MRYYYRTGIVCSHCKQLIVSEHRHDMRYCFCGDCFVDGGKEYLRYGFTTGRPDVVKVRVYVERR